MSGEHLWDGVFGNIKCSEYSCCAVLIFFIHSIRIIFTMDAFFSSFIWVFGSSFSTVSMDTLY